MRSSLSLLAIVTFAGACAAQGNIAWNEAMAEHLLNRAGFGGAPEEIRRLAALGREAAVREMLEFEAQPGYASQETFTPTVLGRPGRAEVQGLTEEQRRKVRQAHRRKDREQLFAYRNWWIRRMIRTPAPLEERMSLFWHGHFTSSFRDVRNSYHMLLQNELFREHALGNFRLLLHGVSRDPAMLEYLDNNRNRKGKPNENFAREVMELFTLGLGNYTEKDIKEAARAFTGWTFRGNTFVFARRQHDGGEKTVLGQTGSFDGGEVLDLLLQQEHAPRHLASRLIAYFVGPGSPKGMVERYASLLRHHGWDMRPVLSALFLDDDFYRPEVIGSKISSPMELMVGICRRLEELPPVAFLGATADLLGQSLFAPPNVKGWEGGEGWITTSTMLARGNFAGYLVEGFTPRKIFADFSEPGAKQNKAVRQMFRGVRGFRNMRWSPKRRLRRLPGVRSAASPHDLVDSLCSRFLGVPVTSEARESLVIFISADSPGPGRNYRAPGEGRLKRLVRLILSLPEAQLG